MCEAMCVLTTMTENVIVSYQGQPVIVSALLHDELVGLVLSTSLDTIASI